ncbi:MAG: hypothetical protein KJO79_08200, partial [Verrucomicrobiae bacterium]|nr:hypothetical protein [Verrucomicrobiae bacterium]NNJ87147.1 hypothetical protein [Akkermansiaceae bacterium]
TMATLAGLLLETVAAFGIVVFAFLMVPSSLSEQWWRGISDFFDYSDFEEIAPEMVWLAACVRLLSFTLMEPFYVSAGFALYINSRTLTEGWDIELAFKRLGARLKNLRQGNGVMLFVLSACSLCLLYGAPSAQAQVSQAASGVVSAASSRSSAEGSAQQDIQDVLDSEDFKIHYRMEDVPVDDSSSSGSSSKSRSGYGMPALFADILFMIILFAVIAGLAYLIYANRHVFTSDGHSLAPDDGPKTREVMGMEVTPESLPRDVVAAARKAWQRDEHQLALSYLYRGSIAWLVHRANVPIDESDTEGDCLRRVQATQNSRIVPYFSDLTHTWIGMAYGQQKPEDQVMDQLIHSWPFHGAERRPQ